MERYKPNVTVACIVHCGGKFLMVEEIIDGKSVFNQPAGHLEAGESLIDACKRELWEETGIKAEPSRLVGIYQFSASAELAFLRFTFVCELDELIQSEPQDGAIHALHWLTPAEINDSRHLRSQLVSRCIDDYLAGKGTELCILDSELLSIAASSNP
ncbi:NUDIX hydrolase [Shewanella litorisediminis]|uniref:Phosphatase NudJ n=1 Tax=Shewanella litorisediminis TaxID=1173586 RepID=A0ABX7FZ89_9GAMM|nr:NUDIX hydrolase [Shewanella litorisediminis]MCL2918681.1 NUDIX hydrolase [Shewanella litorisediminis]QRH00344.1 NUDIX hydrolase [Shewanella litorisediminis]